MGPSRFTGEERRRFVRLREKLPARYREVSPQEVEWESASIMNISTEGMCLDAESRKSVLVPNQSLLEVEFSLPVGDAGDGSLLALKGQVVWQGKKKGGLLVGLRFPELTSKDRQAIREYITSMYVKSYQER